MESELASHEGKPVPDPAARLFERYVEARETGADPKLEDLYREAGGEREDLEQRVLVYEELQDLGDLLCENDPDEEGSVPELQRLGRFKLLETLGSTRLSRVYRALDPKLGREVALKVFARQMLGREDEERWILNEGRSLAKLQHPGIVHVFEHGRYDELYYITMEYVRGPSLAQVLEYMAGRQSTPKSERVRELANTLAPLRARCALVEDIALALSHCHEQGVVHRDVKPSNVLIAPDGLPRLIDFGLAHHESEEDAGTDITQRLLGTPAYIAPEQVDSQRTGTSTLSDQFSLGVVLYELLTLQNPFDLGTLSGTMQAISRAEPGRPRKLNPQIPDDLERICLHCLEIKPGNRYASMRKLAEDLRAFFDHRTISITPPSLGTVTRLWLTRHRNSVRNAALGAAAGFVILTGIWLWQGHGQRQVFAQGVEAIDAGWGTSRSIEDFEALFTSLNTRHEQADNLDQQWLQSALFPSVSDSITRSFARGAGRALEVIAEAREARNALGVGYDPRPWRNLLDRFHLKVGAREDIDRERMRGRIGFERLSSEFDLVLYSIISDPDLFVSILLEQVVSQANLADDAYRLVAFDRQTGSNAFEIEFRNEPDAEFKTLLPALRPAGFLEQMFELTVTQADLKALIARSRTDAGDPQGAQDEDSLQLAQVVPTGVSWISKRPVTWDEVDGFLKASGTFRDKLLFKRSREACVSTKISVRGDAPAIIPPLVAEAYAASVGARLPNAFECALALEHEAFERAEGHKIAGEHTSSVNETDQVGRFEYERTGFRWIHFNSRSFIPLLEQSGSTHAFAFRLALTGNSGD